MLAEGFKVLGEPYTSTYATTIAAAVATYQTAHPTDTNVLLVDLGQSFANEYQSSGYISGDTIHPQLSGQALSGALAGQKLLQSLQPRRFTVIVA